MLDINEKQSNSEGLFKFYKMIVNQTPNWVPIIVAMSFIYLFINFIWSAYLLDGTPDIKDGQCFLHNREEFIGI